MAKYFIPVPVHIMKWINNFLSFVLLTTQITCQSPDPTLWRNNGYILLRSPASYYTGQPEQIRVGRQSYFPRSRRLPQNDYYYPDYLYSPPRGYTNGNQFMQYPLYYGQPNPYDYQMAQNYPSTYGYGIQPQPFFRPSQFEPQQVQRNFQPSTSQFHAQQPKQKPLQEQYQAPYDFRAQKFSPSEERNFEKGPQVQMDNSAWLATSPESHAQPVPQTDSAQIQQTHLGTKTDPFQQASDASQIINPNFQEVKPTAGSQANNAVHNGLTSVPQTNEAALEINPSSQQVNSENLVAQEGDKAALQVNLEALETYPDAPQTEAAQQTYAVVPQANSAALQATSATSQVYPALRQDESVDQSAVPVTQTPEAHSADQQPHPAVQQPHLSLNIANHDAQQANRAAQEAYLNVHQGIPVVQQAQSVQQPHPNVQQSHPSMQIAHNAAQQANRAAQQIHPSLQQTHPNVQQAHPNVQQAHPNVQQFHPSIQIAHHAAQQASRAAQQTHPVVQQSHPNVQQSHPSMQLAHLAVQQSNPASQNVLHAPQQAHPSMQQPLLAAQQPAHTTALKVRPAHGWFGPCITCQDQVSP